jgi:hypothetical protein
VTSFSAIPQTIVSPAKDRQDRACIEVVPAEDAEQEAMNVRMECESDGETGEGSRTLGIQTSPIKDHILVLVDSGDTLLILFCSTFQQFPGRPVYHVDSRPAGCRPKMPAY